MATVDDKKIIFSMVGVSKTIQQNQKQILKNIYLKPSSRTRSKSSRTSTSRSTMGPKSASSV